MVHAVWAEVVNVDGRGSDSHLPDHLPLLNLKDRHGSWNRAASSRELCPLTKTPGSSFFSFFLPALFSAGVTGPGGPRGPPAHQQ